MAHADISSYLSLITSEHADKPKFVATVALSVQPFADLVALLQTIPGLFDLDVAVGEQLDFTGEWIGQIREVYVPAGDTAFSWDIPGQGWDQAAWSSGVEVMQTITLGDKLYRTVLYAKAAANSWDGTIPGAYNAWNLMFGPLGYTIKIYDDSAGHAFTWDTAGLGWDSGVWEGGDHGVMTMRLELDNIAVPVPKLIVALLKGGYLDLRPSGVRITEYLINGVEV